MEESINIVYLRISTDEKRQDLELQFDLILEKYELEEFCLLIDEESAYQVDKIKKREDFFELLEILFDTSKTVKDLYLTYRFPQKQLNLYVWDLSRIMRNLELNMLFFLLCKRFNIRIFSQKDDKIYNKEDFEDPTNKLLELMTFGIDSYGAEKYSHDTSLNIRRAYDKDTHSSKYGMAWSKGFMPGPNWSKHWSESITNTKGEVFPRLTETGRLRMTSLEYKKFKAYIKKLLDMGYMRKDVIKFVANHKGIVIDHPYISKHFRSK